MEAIGKLEPEFPYAATLLVYTVLERCLKLHLLKNRKTLTQNEVDLETKVGQKKRKLSNFINLDDNSFIQQVLAYCTPGTMEKIYKVPDRKYSSFRNKVFHSDLYLKDQRTSDYQSRDKANREYLKTAKEHLVEASELYFKLKIIELNRLLQFEN